VESLRRVEAGEDPFKIARELGLAKTTFLYWIEKSTESSEDSSKEPVRKKPEVLVSSKGRHDRIQRFARSLFESERQAAGDLILTWEESKMFWGLIARDAALRWERLLRLSKRNELHKLNVRFCLHCELPYRPRDGGTVYCSKNCYLAGRPKVVPPYRCTRCEAATTSKTFCAKCKRQLNLYIPRVRDVTCEVCGKIFQTNNHDKKKCSWACVKEWRRTHPNRVITKVPCAGCGRSKHKSTSTEFCYRCLERPVARYPELREIKKLNQELKKAVKGEKDESEKHHSEHRGHPENIDRGDSLGQRREVDAVAR
jgi:hypothetical protein